MAVAAFVVHMYGLLLFAEAWRQWPLLQQLRLLFLVYTTPSGSRNNMVMVGLTTLSLYTLHVAQTHILSLLENGHAPPRHVSPRRLLDGFSAIWADPLPFGWKWARLPLCVAVAWAYLCTGDSRANFLIFAGCFPNLLVFADCALWIAFGAPTTSWAAAN